MRLVVTSRRRRRSCIDIIAGGTVHFVETYFPKFLDYILFKPIIWLLSYLYNKAHGKIWPTTAAARTPCHGKFICPSCGREWSSVRSWPNVNQQCKNCLTYVHPYKQRPLQPWDRLVSNLTYLLSSTFWRIVLFIITFFLLYLFS